MSEQTQGRHKCSDQVSAVIKTLGSDCDIVESAIFAESNPDAANTMGGGVDESEKGDKAVRKFERIPPIKD